MERFLLMKFKITNNDKQDQVIKNLWNDKKT